MKKSYATSEVARFFVTGPTDASTKLSEFYCRLCQKDVSVLTHGSSEVLRHFQGIRHFARDQRLRLETPGWRVLGFDGKPLTEDELERQREKILRAPLVVRDREYPYREGLIPDASGNTNPQLPVFAKVSSLVDVLQLGGSYELVERLWERFVLTASRVNVSVTWSRNEVLVSSVCPPDHMCVLFVTYSLIYLFQSVILNGMFPRTGSSSGWRHTSSSGLSLRTVVPAFGCWWGRGGGTVSTVWLWGWLIAILAMLIVSWSSLGKFCAQLAVGRLWCQFLGGHTPLLRATRSIWEAGVCADCWIIQLLMSGCSNAAYKRLFHCARDARSLFDDRIHRDQTQRCWASWLDAVKTILAKGDWDRWSFPAWAGGCCEQHHRVLAAHCLLPQRDWQERQGR